LLIRAAYTFALRTGRWSSSTLRVLFAAFAICEIDGTEYFRRADFMITSPHHFTSRFIPGRGASSDARIEGFLRHRQTLFIFASRKDFP
jgi:hypothetical protein